MATAVLVNKDLEIGRQILHALADAHVPVNVAFWANVSESGEWQLFIATPLVDSDGPKIAYEQVLRTLHDAGMDAHLPWRRIVLRSTKDPVLKALEKQTEIPTGSIEIVEIANIPRQIPAVYYVTYAPQPTETLRILNESVGDRFVEDAYVYGKMWSAAGLDGLRGLLSKFLHLNHNIVESVIEEVSANKRAVIPNVRLHAKDLRRFKPA
jgi:hypothetical protein